MAIVLVARAAENFWGTGRLPHGIGIVMMLIGVELLGVVGGGSQRWLNLGFMRLQPSELMKVAIVIALARFYEMLPRGRDSDVQCALARAGDDRLSRLRSSCCSPTSAPR